MRVVSELRSSLAMGSGRRSYPRAFACSSASPSSLPGSFRFEYEYFPWGCQYYLETGRMMDADGLDRLKTVRRHLLRRGWLARCARPRQPVGSAAGHLPGLRPVRQRSADPPAARRAQSAEERDGRDDGLGGRPREHRGRVRRHRRPQSGRARARQRPLPSRPACSPRKAASESSASRSTWRSPAAATKSPA